MFMGLVGVAFILGMVASFMAGMKIESIAWILKAGSQTPIWANGKMYLVVEQEEYLETIKSATNWDLHVRGHERSD